MWFLEACIASLSLALPVAQGTLHGERSQKLSGALPAGSSVGAFVVAPDQGRVAFVENAVPQAIFGLALWSAPVTDPASAVVVSSGLGSTAIPAFGPDSGTIFFTASGTGRELFVSPADGSGAPLWLAPGLTNLSNQGFLSQIRVSSDGRFALHVWNSGYPGYQAGVSVAPTDGSTPPQSCCGTFEADISAEFDAEGTHFIVRSGSFGVESLGYGLTNGGQPVRRITRIDRDTEDVHLLAPTRNLQVLVYRGQLSEFAQDYGLFRLRVPLAPVPGRPREVDGERSELLSGSASVSRYRITPDESTLVYVGAMPGCPRAIYRVSAEGPPSPVEIAGTVFVGAEVYIPTGGPDSLVISPDGSRVAFAAQEFTSFRREVFSVPLAGGTPVRLSGPFTPAQGQAGNFAFSPDGARVLYVANQENLFRNDLYSVPSDGSSPAVDLSNLPDSGGVQGPYLVLPDSSGVVFRADRKLDERFELWLAPLDASKAPRRLNGPLLPASDVRSDFWIDPEGEWVYYVADQETDERPELYRSPLRLAPRTTTR